MQVAGLLVFATSFLVIRSTNAARIKQLNGERVLNMSNLNNAKLFKEVFLAYLNAALLEPVLAIVSGNESTTGPQVAINLLTLGSIFWWIWLITDAFDYGDVAQQFKYQQFEGEVSANPKKYAWLKLRKASSIIKEERRSLVGTLQRDVALWFMLCCIAAAWLPGVVTQRDVLHAYAVAFLWTILHHSCRSATTWGTPYLVSLLLPSAALMPLEYCLPLQDVMDCVEDLDSLADWRQFIQDRTGVSLIICN